MDVATSVDFEKSQAVTEKKRFIARIYQKIRAVFEKSAVEKLEEISDFTIKMKTAEKLASRYRNRNAWSGVMGPMLVGAVISLFPSGYRKYFFMPLTGWHNFISVLCILYFVVTFSWSFMHKDIYEKYVMNLQSKEKERVKKENEATIDQLTKENTRLKEENKGLNFFSTTCTAIAHEKLKNNFRVNEHLVGLIINELGYGEFSVGLYIANKENYKMDAHKSTQKGGDNPSMLGEVHSKNDYKYKDYCFMKYLFSNEEGTHFLPTKEKVAEEFKGNVIGINQYACCNIREGKNKRLLLEIIAHNETSFGDEDKMKTYIEKIVRKYLPVIRQFIDYDVVNS